MKNVAFFFSAIATQRLKKQRGKQKPSEEHQDSDDVEECEEGLRVHRARIGWQITRLS